ncbi:MAG: czcR [Parcubacteria group bacterium]|nr:czcR [Parcubacteria group bacterium]
MTETKFILVVEDDPILKNLLGHTLAGKYQTLYASDGNEALALFEQNKPALVLLDLMLPTMDGYAVLETIRKRTDELAKTPIIIVSNLGQQKDIDRAKELGANDFLIKAEVPIEDIVKKIESMLHTVGSPEPVRIPGDVPPSNNTPPADVMPQVPPPASTP